MNSCIHELRLEDFRCGWQSDYNYAKENFPNGTTIVQHNSFGKTEIFYDPVGMHESLCNLYDEYVGKMRRIVDDSGLKPCNVPEFLMLELTLFKIIMIYTESVYDYSCFDSNETKQRIEEIDYEIVRDLFSRKRLWWKLLIKEGNEAV